MDEIEINSIYDEFLSEVEINYNSEYLEYYPAYDYIKHFHNIGENVPEINFLFLKDCLKLDFSHEDIFDEFMKLNKKYLNKKGTMNSFMAETKSLYGYFPIIFRLDDKSADSYAVFHTVAKNLITINEDDTSRAFNMKHDYDIVDRKGLIKFMSSYLNEEITKFTSTNIATIKNVSGDNVILTADLNTLQKIRPKMIFKIERSYYWKNDHALIDKMVDLRKRDLISYEYQVNKDTSSQYYIDYYNKDYSNVAFEQDYTRSELDYLHNNKHFMNNLKKKSGNFSGGFGEFTGITVQINSIYDSTVSAKIYSIDNPNILLREGDILKY